MSIISLSVNSVRHHRLSVISFGHLLPMRNGKCDRKCSFNEVTFAHELRLVL